jgi:hypothetical protein
VADTSEYARRVLATLILFCCACFADSESDRAANAAGTGRRTRSDGGAIASKGAPYRVIEVANGGAVHGKVEVDGDVPPATDAAVAPGADQSLCGASVVDESIVHAANALDNVVVWVSDAREGHALPIERRLEVVHEHCRLAPRVQAAVAGSTVNVRNQDAMLYRLLAMGEEGSDTIAVFRLSDVGQVVPSEKLAKSPGLVAFGSDQHSWSRAWLAVFDHPYFAVTSNGGSFRIDSLPPGKYHLKAWHERAQKTSEREIEITAAGDLLADLKLKLK